MTIVTGNTVQTEHCHYCGEPFNWEQCPNCAEAGEPPHSAPTVCSRCQSVRQIVMECLREDATHQLNRAIDQSAYDLMRRPFGGPKTGPK